MELRVRTVCELALHQEYYLQPQIVSVLQDGDKSKLLKNVVPATSGYYNKACDESVIDTPESINVACFQGDCIETTKKDSWSGMWHIYALASVLKRPIQSIYPEKNLRIRPAYHKLVMPREEQITVHSLSPFSIMWTRVADMPEHRLWSPNHFVPCVPATCTLPRTYSEVLHKKPCSAQQKIQSSQTKVVPCGGKLGGSHNLLSQSQGQLPFMHNQRPSQRPSQCPSQRPSQRPSQHPSQRPSLRPSQCPSQPSQHPSQRSLPKEPQFGGKNPFCGRSNLPTCTELSCHQQLTASKKQTPSRSKLPQGQSSLTASILSYAAVVQQSTHAYTRIHSQQVRSHHQLASPHINVLPKQAQPPSSSGEPHPSQGQKMSTKETPAHSKRMTSNVHTLAHVSAGIDTPVSNPSSLTATVTVDDTKTENVATVTKAKLSTITPPSVSTVLKFQTMSKVPTKGTVPMLTLSRFLIPPKGSPEKQNTSKGAVGTEIITPDREPFDPAKCIITTSDTQTQDVPLITKANSAASSPSVSTVLKFQSMPPKVPTKGTVPMLTLSSFLIPPATIQTTDSHKQHWSSTVESPDSPVVYIEKVFFVSFQWYSHPVRRIPFRRGHAFPIRWRQPRWQLLFRQYVSTLQFAFQWHQ